MKKVLIIIGASKSGSTVLAKSLGGHPKTFTLGEANRFNEELNNPDGVCSCGKSLMDCTFWKRIRTDLVGSDSVEKFDEFPMGMFKQYTGRKNILKLIPTVVFGKKYENPVIDREIDNTLKFYDSVFSTFDHDVLVDSTKGLFRAFVLNSNKKNRFDFHFVHILRDGRGVVNSSLKTKYKIQKSDGSVVEYDKQNLAKPIPVKSPSEAINYWLYVNIRNLILLRLFARKRTTFIRYEDFTKNPERILNKICVEMGLQYDEAMLDFEKEEHHILGGNSSRINATKIKSQDIAWQQKLDRKVIKEFNKKAGWFNRLMGY